jgi:hypothetical protein
LHPAQVFVGASHPISPFLRRLMKKKTVIMTEKREVWVIRRSSSAGTELDIDIDETETSATALIARLDQAGETAGQTENEEQEFIKGEFDHVE